MDLVYSVLRSSDGTFLSLLPLPYDRCDIKVSGRPEKFPVHLRLLGKALKRQDFSIQREEEILFFMMDLGRNRQSASTRDSWIFRLGAARTSRSQSVSICRGGRRGVHQVDRGH